MVVVLGNKFSSIDEACYAFGVDYSEVAEVAKVQGISTDMALKSIVSTERFNIDNYIKRIEPEFKLSLSEQLNKSGLIKGGKPDKKSVNPKEIAEQVRKAKLVKHKYLYVKELLERCKEYKDKSNKLDELINELIEDLKDLYGDVNRITQWIVNNAPDSEKSIDKDMYSSYDIKEFKDTTKHYNDCLRSMLASAIKEDGVEYIEHKTENKTRVSRMVDNLIKHIFNKVYINELEYAWRQRLNNIKIYFSNCTVANVLSDRGIRITTGELQIVANNYVSDLDLCKRKEIEKQAKRVTRVKVKNIYYSGLDDVEFNLDRFIKYITDNCVKIDNLYWSSIGRAKKMIGIREIEQTINNEFVVIQHAEGRTERRLKAEIEEVDPGLNILKGLLHKGMDSREALKMILKERFNSIEDIYDQSDLCNMLMIPESKVKTVVSNGAKQLENKGLAVDYDKLWDKAITIVYNGGIK